jgi:hypothetical protein
VGGNGRMRASSWRWCLVVLVLCASAQAYAQEPADEPTDEPADESVPAEQTAAPTTPPLGSRLTELDLTWRPTQSIWFRPGGVLQTRFTVNHRPETSGEDENIFGVSVPRARLIIDGGVTDYLSFRVRLGMLSGGAATFEQAFTDLLLGPIHLRAGIIYLPISIGDSPAPQDLQGIDYSMYGLQASGGNAAGAGLHTELGRLRMQAYLSNGVRSSFSEIEKSTGARFAVSGRVDARLFTEDQFSRFDTESSFFGSDLALRLGAAAHYEQGAAGGQLANGDFQQYTADVTLEGPGFNLIVAGRFIRIHPQMGETTHDPGVLVQAGVFVHERIELWARYDALFSDGKEHVVPQERDGATDDYQAVGAGINGYLVPRTNFAKFQADFLYVPDAIASTWAAPSGNNGVLDTTEGRQWSLRMQLVVGY